MVSKNNGLKTFLVYFAMILLVFIIILPPVFRIVLKDDGSDKTIQDNKPVTEKQTVLHCTRNESLGEVSYDIQTFSTYKDNALDRVILRYTRSGELTELNSTNAIEQEIINLRQDDEISETSSANGSKFEINKDALSLAENDPIIALYAKTLEEEKNFLTSNNYTCQVNITP